MITIGNPNNVANMKDPIIRLGEPENIIKTGKLKFIHIISTGRNSNILYSQPSLPSPCNVYKEKKILK